MSDIDPTIGRKTATDPRQHFRMAIGSFTRPSKLADITDPVERMLTAGLHAACIDWSRENGTDGHVPLEDLCRLVGLAVEYGKNLIVYGLCHQTDHGCLRCPQPRAGQVYVHDILEHHHSAAQESAISEKRRAAAAASHQKRWGGRTPQPALEGPKRPPGRPRKHPLLATDTAAGDRSADTPPNAFRPEPAVGIVARLDSETIPGLEIEQVLQHPAESRARKRGRSRRTAAREWAPEVVELCDYFADWRARNDPDGKRPTVTERWLNACRLMIELDGRDPEKIRKAIDYSQGSERQRIYVQSMPKLREQYASLQDRAMLDLRAGAVRRSASTPPPAVTVPNMNALYGFGTPGLTRSEAS